MEYQPVVDALKHLKVTISGFGNLSEARSVGTEFTKMSPNDVQLEFALALLGVRPSVHDIIQHMWRRAGKPPLAIFAPYAAFVVSVDVFFFAATESGLISKDRASNRVDIAYLYYLPFCNIFVSCDKLHRRCVPLFLTEDQAFVWGVDLKSALAQIDEHFSGLPESERAKGIYGFAPSGPPDIEGNKVTALWDHFIPKWRIPRRTMTLSPERHREIIEKHKAFVERAEAGQLEIDDVGTDQADSVIIKKMIRPVRGKWSVLPSNYGQE